MLVLRQSRGRSGAVLAAIVFLAGLEDVISEREFKAIFERYQLVAGYHVDQVGRSKS